MQPRLNLLTMKETNIHNILVPLTLDEHGMNSVRQAMIIQDRFDSQITLLYVIPRYNRLGKYIRPAKLRRYKRRSFFKFARFVNSFFDHHIPPYIRLKMQQGSLVRVMISFIYGATYDLIVVNKKMEGRPEMQKKWENQIRIIIREAYCPVITFNDIPTKAKKNQILVPIDIRRHHKHNIVWATRLAREYQAGIHLVSVLNKKIAREKSRINFKIWKITELLDKQKIPSQISFLRGNEKNKHQLMAEFINMNKPDLVVIMTHQEVLVNINSIGEMASSVIRQSEYPVFSITPKKESLFSILIDILKNMNKRKEYKK